MRQRDFDNCSGHIPVSLPSFPLYFCKHEVFFHRAMDNIQKRWTPYTNAISALGAKKLDFIFRERILVVLTYCPSGRIVPCPPYPKRDQNARSGYTPWSLCEQDGARSASFCFFLLVFFGLAEDSNRFFPENRTQAFFERNLPEERH